MFADIWDPCSWIEQVVVMQIAGLPCIAQIKILNIQEAYILFQKPLSLQKRVEKYTFQTFAGKV